MRHRKEEIASALMNEIVPVLAGEGAPSDTNEAGWGVVLDTIEIQDVRVLSKEVFERLQAPYREKLALESLIAEERVRSAQVGDRAAQMGDAPHPLPAQVDQAIAGVVLREEQPVEPVTDPDDVPASIP